MLHDIESVEFEFFNANLYRQAAEMTMARCEGLEVVFEGRSHFF